MTDYTDKILENSQIASQNAAYYDEFWRIEYMGLSQFDRVRGAFISDCIETYEKSDNLNILDFGCGFGWLSLFTGKYGHYVGVDYSAKAIKYANCVYHDYGEFHLAQPDDLYLGLTIKQYDIVIASEVIEHVANHPAFLAQLKLFLKEGGLLILTTPNGLIFDAYERKYQETMQPIENWLTPEEMRQLLADDFEILRHEGVLFRHPVYSLRAYLISDHFEHLFQRLGRPDIYARLLLQVSVYQFMSMLKQ